MTALAYSHFTWDTLQDIVRAAKEDGSQWVRLACTPALEQELDAAIKQHFPQTIGISYSMGGMHGPYGRGLSYAGVIITLHSDEAMLIDGVLTANGRKLAELHRFSPN